MKIFDELIKIDQEMSKAYEQGNEELGKNLEEKALELENEIEEKGLREEFDEYFQNIM